MFNFLRNHQTLFHSGNTIVHPHQQCPWVLFLHVLTNTCYFLIFYCCYSHPSECEVVAYCGFDLHFLCLNWSIIDLQNYVSFRYTAKWFGFIRPWCWERLKAGGEEDNRGWDGWMASPTQWTWVWASSKN